MELYLLDEDLKAIAIVDVFKSMIWTERYYKAGDFELVVSPYDSFIPLLSQIEYINIQESDRTMIFEYLNLHSEIDTGPSLILKGRTLESILERRIVWKPTSLSGDLQTEIEKLLNENIISPTDSGRRISRFEFVASTDPEITTLNIDTQFFGETLYEVISKICESANIGFKMTLGSNGKFQFRLYAGVNRSYSQSDAPYVVFSPNFDNSPEADYIETDQLVRTIVLVAGEKGVGNQATVVSVAADTGSKIDLSRRELFVEATDVSRNNPDGTTLSDAEYLLQLQGRGREELRKNAFLKAFEGEADAQGTFLYGEDFFMGDIVQVEDSYGHQAASRVVELIFSEDSSGFKMYPTFASEF